jgi:cell division septum initiation protein DivIVA
MSRRGFDQGEVRDFLRMVAAELARLQERERFLESEMRSMQTRGFSGPGRLDEETVTTLLGEEAARVLTAARDASTQIRERAEEAATRLVKDAAEDAARLRESAATEAQRVHETALADAEAELNLAKQQGRDMVMEAREYREKVLGELSKRRDAARAQIEQLLHGRDRLMNAFERARIATDDVINGLTEAHDEPEFIVDLSPTTGPIPVINPNHPSVNQGPTIYDVVEAGDLETEYPEVIVEVVEEPTEAELISLEMEQAAEEVADLEVVDVLEAAELFEVAPVEVVEEIIIEDVAVEEVIVDDVIVEDAPVEIQPVEEVAEIEVVEEQPTNVVSLFGRGRKADPAEDIFAKLREATPEAVVEKVAKAEKPAKAAKPVQADVVETPVVEEVPTIELPTPQPERFALRAEAISPIVGQMSRKLKRVLADEQNNVMEHLKGKRTSLEMDAILGTVVEHAARYATVIAEDSMAAASAGVKSMTGARSSSKRVTQKGIGNSTQAVLITGLVAQFREDARIAIGEAEGNREVLSDLMRDIYRKWKMSGIDAHVDDIACDAFVRGSYLSLEPNTPIFWMTDPNGEPCSDCADNALGGVVKKGEEFPTGHQHPLVHVGCRCLVCPA